MIKLHPIVTGAGISSFDGEFSPAQYTLADAKTFSSGVVHLTYTRR